MPPAGMKRKDFVLTSKALDEVEACPAKGVYVATTRTKMAFGAWYGIFIHRFLEYCVERGHDAALGWLATKKMKSVINCCKKIDPDKLKYGEVEVGWCHDPFIDFSRRVSAGLMPTRDPQTEQFGKADLLVELGVPRPLLADYKSGEVQNTPAETTQLLGLAASYRAENREIGEWKGEIDLALVAVKRTGALVWHTQTVDDLELDRYISRAASIHLRVLDDRSKADEGKIPEFKKGTQCKYCDMKPVCPAWT